jgi:putative ABC transport system permease protein
MSLFTLTLTLGFVMIAILLSVWQKLGLERDMVISTIRATVQLLIVGYILKAVFSLQDPIFILIMIALMVGVATQNAKKRGTGLRGITWRVLTAISISEVVTLGFLLVLHIVPPTPQFIIPISGMVIGNSMVIASLFLNRLQSEAKGRKPEILLLLSLGGTPKQSIRHVIKEAIRASMIPTVDSMKTIGLVQLPGMMTGQIIAGADPIQAVRYQLLIVFSLLAEAALTSMILGFLTYPCLFNEHQQLVMGESE